MDKKVKLIYQGKEYSFPLLFSSEEEGFIDISKLRSTANLTSFDPGFANSSPSTSSITFIDGEKGILRYRGYDVVEVCNNFSFLQTSYLIIYGELPSAKEEEEFRIKLERRQKLPNELLDLAYSLPDSTHPMVLISMLISSLSAFYAEDYNDFTDNQQVEEASLIVLGHITAIVALAFCKLKKKELSYPRHFGSFSHNFIKMIFGNHYDLSPELESILEKLLIIHIDHEFNCSTSTVRLVGSSQSNLFVALSSGVNALWGGLHGGANEKVIQMLESIQGKKNSIKTFLGLVKDKSSGVRLMGFGHRVYKSYDPRAKIIKSSGISYIQTKNKDPLLDIAMELEKEALKDEYFIQRKLYPNVDFYSGIIYRSLGIPTVMYTPLFVLGRIPGWIAHWKEQVFSSKTRIGRPRQLYLGKKLREVKK